MYQLAIILAVASFTAAFPQPEAPIGVKPPEPQPLVYFPERQQYFQYNYPVLDQGLVPRLQPQLVLYHGGAPGQFLLQPGSPPGNFLVPQPGPNVILRDSPQRPIFVAGYPKPAHIPPIEKDAEEVPTNPAQIPPLKPQGTPGTKKPEKLEDFDEVDGGREPLRPGTETEIFAADQNPSVNNLKPGQRFFILNGQPLFNYPFGPYPQFQNPNVNLKFNNPIETEFVRNAVTGQIDDVAAARETPENIVLLNQPGAFNSFYKEPENPGFDTGAFGEYRFADSDGDSIIIDARDDGTASEKPESEPEASGPAKSGEPSISQAQPGAVALAGPGGMAEAAPKATAFVGKEGVAISSPQATAVAGPSKDQYNKGKKDKRKQ